MQLQQFDKKTVTSVEKEMRSGPAEETVVTDQTLELKEQTDLTDWVKVTLGQKAGKIKTTSKLENHPCVVTVEEMAAARHFIKTQVPALDWRHRPVPRAQTSRRSRGSQSCSHSSK
jgi:TNF receptor-associated protein 1